MVQIPKASDDDKERFRSLVPDDPGVVVKPMFGNLGAFVNGNMFAGLFGPEGRPMGDYVGLPTAWSNDPERVSQWVERAHSHVRGLPPKPPKPPKAQRPASRGPTTR